MGVCHTYLTLLRLFLVAYSVSLCNAEMEETNQVGTLDVTSQNDTFNKATCNKERAGCCSRIFLDHEDVLMKCFAIHSPKMATSDKSVNFVSCLVECLFKAKRYMTKSETINMKMVKLDAERRYAERAQEKAYHIKVYDFCRKEAVNAYNAIKSTPGGRALLKDTCRPYFMLVYFCVSDYHTKQQDCPYFRWEGSSKDGTLAKCKADQSKCYEIVGQAIHENLTH